MNRSFYTKVVWTSILVWVMFVIPMSLEACPGCKNLDDPISKGFNWSILFLMAMPFTVFGIVGGTIFLHFNGYQSSVVSYWLKRVLMRVRNLFN